MSTPRPAGRYQAELSTFENDRREHMAQAYPEWQQQINPPRHWTGTYTDAPHTLPAPPVEVRVRNLAVMDLGVGWQVAK